MQNNTPNRLSCSVFGHNLERVSNHTSSNSQLSCKTCGALVSVSHQGEFDTHPLKNERLISALKHHFILQNKTYRQQISF